MKYVLTTNTCFISWVGAVGVRKYQPWSDDLSKVLSWVRDAGLMWKHLAKLVPPQAMDSRQRDREQKLDKLKVIEKQRGANALLFLNNS